MRRAAALLTLLRVDRVRDALLLATLAFVAVHLIFPNYQLGIVGRIAAIAVAALGLLSIFATRLTWFSPFRGTDK